MPENPGARGLPWRWSWVRMGEDPSARVGPGGTPRDAEVSQFLARCLHQPWAPCTLASAPLLHF